MLSQSTWKPQENFVQATDSGRSTPANQNDAKVLAGPRLNVLEQTNQLKGILTLLRDKTLSRSDFIFYTDRLSALVVEKALSLLTYKDVEVTTPQGNVTMGKQLAAENLVGVSVLRSSVDFTCVVARSRPDVLRSSPAAAH